MSGLGQILGGAIGAVVGFYAGNPALGYAIGSGIGGYVTAEDITQPLLEDFSVDSNGYGSVIKIINGTDKVQCVPIWAEFNTQENTESAKGGPTSTTFEYSVDIALLIGEPVDGLLRIWHGADLIVDNRPSAESGGIELESGFLVSHVFYDGNASQEADPLMESYLGVGNVPAYRGVSMLVITGLDITDTGGRAMPVFVEVRAPDKPEFYESSPTDYGTQFTWPHVCEPVLRTDSTLTSVASEYAGQSYYKNYERYFIKVGNINGYMIEGQTIFSGGKSVPVTGPMLEYLNRNGDLYYGPGPWVSSSHARLQMKIRPLSSLSGGWFAAIGLYHLPAGQWVKWTMDIPSALFIHESGAFVFGDIPGDEQRAVTYRSHMSTRVIGCHLVTSKDGKACYFAFGSHIYRYSIGYESISGSFSFSRSSNYIDTNDLLFPTDRVESLHLSDEGDLYIQAGGVGFQYIYKYDSSMKTLKSVTDNIDGAGNQIMESARSIVVVNDVIFTVSGRTIRPYLISQVLDGSERTQPYSAGEFTMTYGTKAAYIPGVGIQTTKEVVTIFSTSAAPEPLSDIVANYCRNLDPSKYDTSLLTDSIDGVTIDRATTGNAAIASLQKLFFFSGYSDGAGKIIFRPAGTTPTITIDADDLGAGVDEGADSRVVMTIPGEQSRPKEVRIGYRPRAAQYENAVQTIRLAASDTQEVIENSYKIVISDQVAKNIAHRMAHDMAVRARVSISLPLDYQNIVPGDIISVPDGERSLSVRVSRVARSQVGIISIDGERVLAAPPPQTATEFVIDGQQIAQVPAPDLIVYQGILRDQDDNLGIYVIGGQRGTTTDPASIKTSVAGGSWQSIGSVPGTTITGYTISAMPDGKPDITDYQRSVSVMLWDDQAVLDSITYAQLMNEQNAAIIGNEVVLFKTATLQANGSFLLECIVGGRQGTEQEMGGHSSGERFALIKEELMFRHYFQQSSIGVARSFSLSIPRSADSDTEQVTQSGVSLKPWAPVHVGAVLSGGITISWVPRYRVNSSWTNGVDASADANEQSWRVDIYDQADDVTLLRTATVSTASYLYVDHVADGVNTSAKIRICVTQISTIVGDGYEADNMVIIKT